MLFTHLDEARNVNLDCAALKRGRHARSGGHAGK
jgi:hypothetical protein